MSFSPQRISTLNFFLWNGSELWFDDDDWGACCLAFRFSHIDWILVQQVEFAWKARGRSSGCYQEIVVLTFTKTENFPPSIASFVSVSSLHGFDDIATKTRFNWISLAWLKLEQHFSELLFERHTRNEIPKISFRFFPFQRSQLCRKIDTRKRQRQVSSRYV